MKRKRKRKNETIRFPKIPVSAARLTVVSRRAFNITSPGQALTATSAVAERESETELRWQVANVRGEAHRANGRRRRCRRAGSLALSLPPPGRLAGVQARWRSLTRQHGASERVRVVATQQQRVEFLSATAPGE